MGDVRDEQRRARDEQIASEPKLAPPVLEPDAAPSPVEHYLTPGRRPFAVAGIVENGLVRPLDTTVKLPEHARVIIVATNAQ